MAEEGLTRDELLILLVEECGEVIQAATKCLRFGFDVDHGVDYGNNRMVLSREVGDLLAVIDVLPLDDVNVAVTRRLKIKKAEEAKLKYGRRALVGKSEAELVKRDIENASMQDAEMSAGEDEFLKELYERADRRSSVGCARGSDE
jgi:hypothetical protein